MTTDAAAVRAIAELAEEASAKSLEIEGRTYSSRELHPCKAPEPEPLVVHSLTGLAGYVMSEVGVSDWQGSQVLIHVVGPRKVELVTSVHGNWSQRFVFARAIAPDPIASSQTGFAFGRFVDLETMNVALQTLFEETGDRAKVLRLVGNVRDEMVGTLEDDGVTQTVTARSGVAVVENVEVPNPVTLHPFRTFPEIDQPASRFVLRMRRGKGAPEAGLFLADGGAWEQEAGAAIKGWIEAKDLGIGVIA